MKNNEIQKLLKGKNEKEKFYILRRELVRESCKDVKEKSDIYQKYININPDAASFLPNPSIRQRILDDLKEDGFFLEEKGTQYIATLSTIYFHERKLFRRKDIIDNGYFDLSLKYNAHYSMLGTKPDIVREEITKSIKHSGNEYISIEELVYELADKYIYLTREKGDEKNISYSKKLLRNKSECI